MRSYKSPHSAPTLAWLSFGALGDALMMSSAISSSIATKQVSHVQIFARRNAAMIMSIVENIPNTKVHTLASWKDGITTLRLLRPNTILFIPPTFGTHSKATKTLLFLARYLRNVRVIGFADAIHAHRYVLSKPFNATKGYYENVVDLLNMAGICVNGKIPSISFLAPQNNVVHGAAPTLVVHPCAANSIRSFPVTRWIEIVQNIQTTIPQVKIVVTGGAQDTEVVQKIVTSVSGAEACLNKSVPELALILSKSDVFLGPDTGVTHLASMLGVSSIVIGNQSNPTWLPNYAPKTKILFNSAHCTCDGKKGGDCRVAVNGNSYYACMYYIANQDVINEVSSLLNNRRIGREAISLQ